jgi:hypothetical protein
MREEITHKIDYISTSQGLGLSIDETKELFNDGRVMGRFGEFIYANRTNTKRSGNENLPYDIIGENNLKIEVRSVTPSSGLSFASSKEVGSGREVTEEGFKEKMDSVDMFVAVDYRNIEEIKLINVTKDDINNMMSSEIIRKNKSVQDKKFYKYIENND